MDECVSWANARTVKFLELLLLLFRNYECLWGINSPQYSNGNKRLDVMSAIDSELNIHFVEFGYSVC